jgi:hypothetical protein
MAVIGLDDPVKRKIDIIKNSLSCYPSSRFYVGYELCQFVASLPTFMCVMVQPLQMIASTS